MNKITTSETAFIGTRLRERRLAAGVKQAELADKTGISASYLNLIEHNRRRIGGKLLVSLAKALDVEPQALSHGAEAELIEALHDAGQDGEAAKVIGADTARIEEFAEKFPGWAQLIAQQGGRIAQLETLIDGLNDRLTHDPVLSETMHDVLSTVSAIRSTASILVATPDIDAEWRHRFHNNIDTESRRLAETSAAMAEHFEHLTQSSASYVAPLDATQSFLEGQGNHFPRIETEGEAAIESIVSEADLSSRAASDMLRAALHRYARRAAAMPQSAIADAVKAEGLMNLGQIVARFGTGLDDLMVRLSEIARFPDLPEMGCVQCDGAGALVTRNSLPDFPLPRFGAACNLWPLFASLSTPDQPIHRVVRTSENVSFSTFSFAKRLEPPGFGTPPIFIATMLIVADAPQEMGLEIGAACRVCPHKSCAARREPTILETFTS